jgi:hypothetical protein
MFSEDAGLIITEKARTLADIAEEEGVFTFEEISDIEKDISSIRAHTLDHSDSGLRYFKREGSNYMPIEDENEFVRYHNNIIIDEAKTKNKNQGDEEKKRFERKLIVYLGGKSNVSVEKVVNGSTHNYIVANGANMGEIGNEDFEKIRYKTFKNITSGLPARKGISFYNNNGSVGVKYHEKTQY